MRRDVFNLPGLALDLSDSLTYALDQVVNLPHRAIEDFAQLAQLIAAIGLEVDGHVAGRDLVHHRPEAFQRGAGRGVETAVEIEDQYEHHRQRHRLQDHVCAVLRQTLLQLRVEEFEGGFVELVSPVDQHGDLIVERLPRRIEGVGHHHLLFEQLAGLFQRGLAAVGHRAEGIPRGFAGAEGVLQFQRVLGLEFFDLHHQLIETGARRTVEKTLAQ
ncbi:hypothetical protein D3C81_1551830 [compost metagenome]